jgi:diguanylate cyclase (GGDEF)-like protein
MIDALRHERRLVYGVVLTALAVHLVHGATGFGGHLVDALIAQWLYDALTAGAAAACLWRAATVKRERGAWAALGAGMALSALGDVVWSAAYAHRSDPPYPSIVDALYVAYYPLVWVGFVRLAAGRRAGAALWFDGVAAALGISAVAAAFLVGPALDGASITTAAAATTLAYPLGDILLLAVIGGALATVGWRPDRRWALIAGGLTIGAVTDSIFLAQVANGTYTEGGVLDTAWPVGALLIALAAVQPPRARAERSASAWRVLLVPSLLGTLAVALLLFDHFHRLNLAAVLLATAALITLVIRATLSFGEHARMLESSRHEALDDGLTGLGNRRRLQRDLDRAFGDPETLRVLVLFDLDGFKTYNDTFGHPAGDALLVRLGHRLSATVAGRGSAYRMGGDEFCALIEVPEDAWAGYVETAAEALCEHGEAFSVTASHGAVLLRDVEDPTSALRFADQQMYIEKEQRRPAGRHHARDVLVTILHEVDPDLQDHLRDVTDLAIAVGGPRGHPTGDLEVVAPAAELHDIGKMAVPDAVLHKPGPLTSDEERFIHQHTIVGERVLGAAPTLRSVARLVRHSHERWDGTGYPDGLAGEDIPLGARIVAVCDAYDAMTTDRAYREAVPMEQALEELRQCAGSQFDPVVVDTFCAVAEGIRDALAQGAVFDLRPADADAA